MSRYSVNLGLPAQPLVEDPKLFSELIKVYNAIRNLALAHDAVTGIISPPTEDWSQLGTTRFTAGGMHKIYIEANVDLAYGNTVGIVNVAGVGKADKAQDGVLYAVGFCSATGGTLAGATTEVTIIGRYPPLPAASLVPGNKYYQSGTAGTIGVFGTGTQVIGFAVSDTDLIWLPQL